MTEQLIPCSEAVKRLWEYLDNAISPEEQESVEKHLAFCRTCCGELEFAREVRSFLATGTSDVIPQHVRDHLERFLDEL
ncbi:MAG TPA: zf-HC2 domain-containing protein [Actinomycetota bacterium]